MTAEIIGRAHILNVLRTTPERAVAIAEGLSADQLRARPQAGEWSMSEVLAHLVLQEEQVLLPRFWRMVAEDSPSFPTSRGVIEADPTPADDFALDLATLRDLRARTLAILEALADTGWERVGTSPTRGTLTIEGWARYAAHHDLEHLAQLESIATALPP